MALNVVEIWRDLHKTPELGFEEEKTSAYLAEALEKLGYAVTRGVGKTGVMGVIRGAEPGPVLMLRADMDALPFRNDDGSIEAVHACGHDSHCAMVLAAASELAGRVRRGTLKILFQPGEETLHGALEVLKSGAVDDVDLKVRRRDLQGRTPNQRLYLKAIMGHDISFGVGPAGTGKTFLAVAAAVDAFERGTVERIVLTRPAVEAGERLGFLPGDLTQKVDPYLRPLYDALFDLMGFEKSQRLMERQSIEVAPLAYMRGRTLNNAFVILDEAQNTTPEQMKMFLTRIGFGSKAVITGDVTQIDLPKGVPSGLKHAIRILDGVRGIEITRFTSKDVVRHPLVARIVDAYEEAAKQDELAAKARKEVKE